MCYDSDKNYEIKEDLIMGIWEKLTSMGIDLGANLLGAILILIIGFKVAKMVKKTLAKTFERAHMDVSLQRFLLPASYVAVCGITIFIAAEHIGISSASIIAVLGSAGVALSLSMQNMLANFVGGIIILIVKPYKVGDYIICTGGEGIVQSIGLVYTTLTTGDNKQIVIPNGTMSNTNLTNVSAQDRRRVDLLVGIGYQSDLKKAKEIMQRLFEEHELVRKEDGITVFVDSLGESAVTIGGRGWVAAGDYWTAKWELTEAVKLAYDEAGIEIPFNQLDVHVKQDN